MKIINKLFIFIITAVILTSCSSEPKIPVWKISKAGSPDSYLMQTSNYLSKQDIDVMFTNNIIEMFDSCEALITFWDLKTSSLVETKQWIEIGNNRTLKDTLSKNHFELLNNKVLAYNSESGNFIKLPDSIKIKPQFYLNDIITVNNRSFNFEQFFLNRSLPQQKETIGLENFQNYYQSYSSINFDDVISKLNDVVSIHKDIEALQTKSKELYKGEKYQELFELEKKSISKLGLNAQDLLNKNGDLWSDKIDITIDSTKTFIALDINYCSKENSNSLFHKLLSKGYNLERVN